MAKIIHLKPELPINSQKIVKYPYVPQLLQSINNPVLVTGIFDVVHIGHMRYLAALSNAGYSVVVGLENDQTARINKGPNRPINPLRNRLGFIAGLESVTNAFGFTQPVKYIASEPAYLEHLNYLKPKAIAITNFDVHYHIKIEQAQKLGINVIIVHKSNDSSTTHILELLKSS